MIVFLFKIFACVQQFVVILLETSGENFKKLSEGGEKRKVQNPKIYEIKLVKTNGSKIQRSESDFPKLVFPLQSPPSFFFSLCNLSSFFLPCPSIYFEFVVSYFFFLLSHPLPLYIPASPGLYFLLAFFICPCKFGQLSLSRKFLAISVANNYE